MVKYTCTPSCSYFYTSHTCKLKKKKQETLFNRLRFPVVYTVKNIQQCNVCPK